MPMSRHTPRPNTRVDKIARVGLFHEDVHMVDLDNEDPAAVAAANAFSTLHGRRWAGVLHGDARGLLDCWRCVAGCARRKRG